ncbi:MAG: alpha/beta hydrolase [Actinomycetota bacterium]|nr:alpha/beta hydrolase [Actinomycetota bacterium]
MPHDDVHVDGTSGSPVLLLPGGAATSRGFFPGLVEALDGHRVISLDRPGTGLASERGTASLPSGSSAAADAIRQLDAGPAVVVAQSLGGAVAVQLAMDHPEVVAGLVLIDPTPVDLPELAPLLRRVFALLGLPGRLPVLGPRLDLLVWRALGMRAKVAQEARGAYDVMIRSATLHTTSKAVASLQGDVTALAPRLRPLDVPVVIVTADRKQGDKVRQSHERLAGTLGGRIVAPPGAVHAEHLRDPRSIHDLVLKVLAEVSVASGGKGP